MNRVKGRLEWVLFGGLAIAALVLYASTLTRGLLQGDALDLQTAMVTLGVPHATSYPLFTMLGWVWVHLVPWGEAATRASLLSALFGALTVAMVYRLALDLTGRHLAALAGAISLGLSYVFWTQTSIAEVYTLNTLLLTLVLAFLWRWEAEQGGPRSPRYLLLAALVYGLGLAHHRLMALLLPALLLYVWQVDRQVWRNRRLLLRLALLVGVGLSLYLYVPWRKLPEGATLWEVVWSDILGADFVILLGRPIDRLGVLWSIPRQEFSYLGLALAAIGAGTLLVRPSSRKRAVLLLLTYASPVLLCLVYWVPDPEVFLTPCFVVIALWIAVGTAAVARRMGPRLATAGESLAVLLALLLLTNLPRVRAYTLAAPGDYDEQARQILAYGFEPGAVVQADWETATAMRYVQAVDGMQPDLSIVRLRLGLRPEYERLLARLDRGQVVYFPLTEGLSLTRFPAGYTLAPVDGRFLRATRGDTGYESVDKAIAPPVNLLGYRTGEQALTLFWQAHGPLETDYATFVHFFDSELLPLGQADKQGVAEGSYIFPTSRWGKDQVVQDVFPAAPPTTAYVRTGMYSLSGQTIQPLGRAVVFLLDSPSLEEVPHRLGVSLGERVVLWGYELSEEGDGVRLVLYWGSRGEFDQDYTVFVHLTENEQIVYQVDRQPLGGFYPTSMWREGQVVRDVYHLSAPPAGAEIRVGMYDPRTMQRLPRADVDADYVIVK
jgi:hypothetical protein